MNKFVMLVRILPYLKVDNLRLRRERENMTNYGKKSLELLHWLPISSIHGLHNIIINHNRLSQFSISLLFSR